MNRIDLIAARVNPTIERRPRKRPAPKRPGDELGRIRCGVGVSYQEAIAAARTKQWWPRVRSESPTLSHGYWCWPLREP